MTDTKETQALKPCQHLTEDYRMNMKEQVEKHNAQPMYRANNQGQVMQRSVMTLQDDGTASTSMGFPICEVPEYVEPRLETAQLIARLLNEDREQK